MDTGAVQILYAGPGRLQATTPDDQLWSQGSPGVKEAAEDNEGFGSSLASGDFNGDGFADLAVGTPIESLGTVEGAGAVNVLYGSTGGLQADQPDDQLWTQDSPGVLDRAERDDLFGDTLVVGNFNGDRFDDLAIGVTQESLGGPFAAGAVELLSGSARGLQAGAPDDQFWSQDSPGVQGDVEEQDLLSAGAAGDFNGDGFDDLVLRIPFEDAFGAFQSGAAQVLYGSRDGLQADTPDDQIWSQDSPSVKGEAEEFENLASAVAAADFNADGFADLVIGTPEDSVGSAPEAGAVNVLYGSTAGLQADQPDDQLWTQARDDVLDESEPGDRFGGAFAEGDFDGDGYADLAIGISQEGVGAQGLAGAVEVLYGRARGLQAVLPDDQLWTQDSAGVMDTAEEFDGFGSALSAAQFNGDGYADLAIGVPGEAAEGIPGALDLGVVAVLYSTSFGLQADFPRDQRWSQQSPEVTGRSERGDRFGQTLTGP